MLDYACAMGALIATYTGACPDYSIQEITTLTREPRTKYKPDQRSFIEK
jgi:hypothetical protein